MASETLIERVRKLTAENGELSVSNAALEVDVAGGVWKVPENGRLVQTRWSETARSSCVCRRLSVSWSGSWPIVSLRWSKRRWRLRRRSFKSNGANIRSLIYSFISRTARLRNKWPNVSILNPRLRNMDSVYDGFSQYNSTRADLRSELSSETKIIF